MLLEIPPGTMPDSIVSACNALDGVSVVWISRYAAGGNLFLDLEVVEEITADPKAALTGWSTCCRSCSASTGPHGSPDGDGGSCTRPRRPTCARHRSTGPTRLDRRRRHHLECAARLDDDEIIAIGRRGGPEFLDSELARLGHLLGLAITISRPRRTRD